MRHQCATVADTFCAPRLASFWAEERSYSHSSNILTPSIRYLERFLQLTPEWLTIRPLAAVTLGIIPTQGRADARTADVRRLTGRLPLNHGSRSRGDRVRRTRSCALPRGARRSGRRRGRRRGRRPLLGVGRPAHECRVLRS